MSRGRWRTMSLALALAAGVSTSLAAPACGPETGERPVVDDALVAYLSKARALHHLADLSVESGDREGALRAVRQIISGKSPGEAPEVKEARADAFARVASLESELGHHAEAVAAVELGLKEVPDVSYFRGHLFETLGVVEQREFDRLSQLGDEAGARATKERAIKAFEEAVAIQSDVIERLLPK